MTAKRCQSLDPEECGSPHESLDNKRYPAYASLGWGLWPWVLRAPWRFRLHWDGFPDKYEREARRDLLRYGDAYPLTRSRRLMRRAYPYIPFHVCERLQVCFNHWLGNYGLHPKRDPVDGGWYYVSTQRYHGRFYTIGMIVGDDIGPDGEIKREAAYDILPPGVYQVQAEEGGA